MVSAVSKYSHVHITTLARMYTYSKAFYIQKYKPSSQEECSKFLDLEVLERLFIQWHSPIRPCYQFFYSYFYLIIYFTNFTLRIPSSFTCFYFTFAYKPYRIFFFSLMMLWIGKSFDFKIFQYQLHSSFKASFELLSVFKKATEGQHSMISS